MFESNIIIFILSGEIEIERVYISLNHIILKISCYELMKIDLQKCKSSQKLCSYHGLNQRLHNTWYLTVSFYLEANAVDFSMPLPVISEYKHAHQKCIIAVINLVLPIPLCRTQIAEMPQNVTLLLNNSFPFCFLKSFFYKVSWLFLLMERISGIYWPEGR